MSIYESEQMLTLEQTVSTEPFDIIDTALVSVEGITIAIATAAALTTAIALDTFAGARQIEWTVIGGTGSGTIAIAGTDGAGDAQTETLTFTGTNRTQTTTHAYVSSGLTATPATFTDGAANATATVLGNWVVQSARKNAETPVWLNEFEAGDALTENVPIAEIKGSPSRVYRVKGDNAGITAWKDDCYSRKWK